MERIDSQNETQDERKLVFYASLGRFTSGNKEVRSTGLVGLKQVDAWREMFPGMFPDIKGPGYPVSENSAQRLSAVFTCLNVLGETLGSLPFDVKQNTSKGPKSAHRHAVHRLIHDRPNQYMTAFTFWSAMWKLRFAWGNAYAEIIRDESYTPVELKILLPWMVTILKNPDGDIYYKYKGRTLYSTDVLHLKNYCIDGLCGLSTIRQNALTIGLGLKLNSYNASIIGERPYGYLTSQNRPKNLQQKNEIRNLWNKRNESGDENVDSQKAKVESVNGIPYLYGGLEFKSFTLPADDVAYIESAKLTNQDIYGMFRVPPTLAQNYEKAPYNSSEQQDIVFAKYSLQSIRDTEQECNEKLFTEYNKTAESNYYCKFNLNGLLRGDMNARQAFYSSGINNGWLNPSQVAELEDLPSVEGGDIHMVNSTLIPINQLEEWIDSKIAKNLSPSPGSGNNSDNEDNNQRAAIVAEIRTILKSKMNGHFADIEQYLQ